MVKKKKTNKKEKVCILTSVHPPDDIRVFQKEAKALAMAGYTVTLLAQHDKNEIVDGISIVRLPKPRNRMVRMTIMMWSNFRRAIRVNADIYHFHDSELIPLGILLRMLGYKVIYEIGRAPV